MLYSTSTSMPGTVGSIETSTISCTDCLSTFSMSRRERSVRVQEVQLDTSWLHQSPLHRPSSSKKQLQLSSSIVINVKARAGARLRRSVDPMQQFVCLPYQLMRSAVGVIVVLALLLLVNFSCSENHPAPATKTKAHPGARRRSSVVALCYVEARPRG